MEMLVAILLGLAAWIGAAIVVIVIFHFCLSPRRMEKRWLERQVPPLPSGSINRDGLMQ